MSRTSRALLLTLGGLLAPGCRGIASSATDTPDARESPQASAQPALLAATTPASAAPALGPVGEGGPPPLPFRGDEILSPDPLGREGIGYTLSAVLRPTDLMGPPRSPEVNAAGLDAGRKATELRLAIDLSPSRMRVVLAGHGFVLPADAEIRSRSDRYGHVIVWPGGASYRPLAPGAMRALLGERRFDVAPITPAEIAPRDDGPRRIGIRTRRIDVTTRAARASFEIGKLDGAGEGGVLLCRMLLDLMNAPPGTAACGVDELPVHVELRWTNHGSLVFDLTGYLKRPDIPATPLLVPPPTASFAAAPLPVSGISALLGAQELSAFRTTDVEVGTGTTTAVPAPGTTVGSGGGGGSGSGGNEILAIVNATVELRVLYLDGVAVAWAAPGARGDLRGLRRGRYVAQWRTFLGDAVDPAITQVVPGTAQVGLGTDAGH
jgi:hypothetical protein